MGKRTRLAAEERTDLASFLETLSPAQWSASSLCAGWTVRDVVAHHVSFDELGFGGVMAAAVKGRFLPARINAARLAAMRDRGPDELVAILRAHPEPRGLGALLGGGVGLTDCVIHHQDIRRPLGMPRTIPSDRLRETLGIAMRAPVLPARHLAKGLRLVATDLDWTVGAGPVVEGPAEALLMAVAGRPDSLPELAGEGVTTLQARLSPPA